MEEYTERIPTNVLHWYENGELVKNPEFSNNMEVYRVGINENFNDIQDLRSMILDITGTIETHTADIETMKGDIETLYSLTATIPNKTSDLVNDSGFITEADVPTKNK